MRRPKPPWPLWGWFGGAKPGGFPRVAGFRIGWCFCESPHCESLSHGFAVPAPFSKGAFLRPVSFYGAISGFFNLPIDSVGTKRPKNTQPKTGAEAETHHPSQSEGSIPVGSSRGILKGGTIRAGASCSPLEPDNFPSFLAGARKEGPAGKRLQKAD